MTVLSVLLFVVGLGLVLVAVEQLTDWRISALLAGAVALWFSYVASTRGES